MDPKIKELQVACFAAAQKLGSTSPTSEKLRQSALTLGDLAEESQDMRQLIRDCSENPMARVALREFMRSRPNLFQ